MSIRSLPEMFFPFSILKVSFVFPQIPPDARVATDTSPEYRTSPSLAPPP